MFYLFRWRPLSKNRGLYGDGAFAVATIIFVESMPARTRSASFADPFFGEAGRNTRIDFGISIDSTKLIFSRAGLRVKRRVKTESLLQQHKENGGGGGGGWGGGEKEVKERDSLFDFPPYHRNTRGENINFGRNSGSKNAEVGLRNFPVTSLSKIGERALRVLAGIDHNDIGWSNGEAPGFFSYSPSFFEVPPSERLKTYGPGVSSSGPKSFNR